MIIEQDRNEAAQQARFAKYQNEADVPQADRELLAFLESWRFILPFGAVILVALLVRAGVL